MFGELAGHTFGKITVVFYAKIECDIDIHTFATHQLVGQIVGQIFDQSLARC